jgi:prolyl 4-hydroxylase
MRFLVCGLLPSVVLADTAAVGAGGGMKLSADDVAPAVTDPAIVARMAAVRAKEEAIAATAAKWWASADTRTAEAEAETAAAQRSTACPARDASLKSGNVPGAAELQFTARNRHKAPVDLAWLDFGGAVVNMGTIGAGEQSSMTTYEGHAWRMSVTTAAGAEVVLAEGRAALGAGGAGAGSSLLIATPCKEALAELGAEEAAAAAEEQAADAERQAAADAADAAAAQELAADLSWVDATCPHLTGKDDGWLGDHPVVGYHPLCLRWGSEEDSEGGTTRHVDVAAFRGGELGATPGVARLSFGGSQAGSTAAEAGALFSRTLRRGLERLVRMKRLHTDGGRAGSKEQWQPQAWALFDTYGHRHSAATPTDAGAMAAMATGGPLLLFVGGAFIHPGVRIGFRRSVPLPPASGGGTSVLVTMSLSPLVFSVHSFLTVGECDHIIGASSPHMAKSLVSHMDHDVGKPDEEFRTSTTHFLSSDGDDLLQTVDRRLANLTRTSQRHHEHVQVLRYQRGQQYGAHHDYWPTESYTQPDIVSMTHGGWKNRLVTVFWYMSDVALGGETNFPQARGFETNVNSPDVPAECQQGLRVKPERGKVIIFYSLLPDGTGDVRSLHGACPVIHGIKWAANKWVWNQPQGYIDIE